MDKAKKACSVEGCEKGGKITKNFCVMHYARFRKNGDPGLAKIKEVRMGCMVKNCERAHSCKGYCQLHYTRFYRHGDPGSAELLTSRHPKCTYNPEAFTNEDDISWYLLGAFMSDGNVRIRKTDYISKKDGKTRVHKSSPFSMSSNDLDWLEMIVDLICPGKAIYERKRKGRANKSYEVQFNCQIMFDWLISKGCTPRKSLTLKFPKVDHQYLPDFLRGQWDGDGSVAIYRRPRKGEGIDTHRQGCLSSSSLPFVKSARRALKSLGIETFITKHLPDDDLMINDQIITTDNPNYRLELRSGEMVYRLCKLVYYTGCRIYLSRKLAVTQEIVSDWERPFYCDICKEVLTLTSSQRGGKNHYCRECAEEQKIKKRKICSAKRRETIAARKKQSDKDRVKRAAKKLT